MPNLCNYELKIIGSKDAIKRVVECLKAHYNYTNGKPEHKHFFRIFDVYDDEEMENNGDGTFTQFVFGDCAWSVWSCMCSGEHTYYKDLKENHPDIFMGTDLCEQSQDCEIEVFSEEEGMGFSEHYLFKNGELLIDECVDIEQAGYDDNNEITTDIDWENYDGDYLCINPNRVNQIEEYRWTI